MYMNQFNLFDKRRQKASDLVSAPGEEGAAGEGEAKYADGEPEVRAGDGDLADPIEDKSIKGKGMSFDDKVAQIETTSSFLSLPAWESAELVSTVQSKPTTIDQILVIVREYKRCIEKLEALITNKNKLQVNIIRLSSGGTTDPIVYHQIYQYVQKSTKLSLQCLYTYCCIRRLESTPRVYIIGEGVTIFEYLSHDARLLFEFVRRIDFYEEQEGFTEFLDELYLLMILGGNWQAHSESILKYNPDYLTKKAEFSNTLDRILQQEARIIESSKAIAAVENERTARKNAYIEEEEKGRADATKDAAKCKTEKERELKMRKYNDEAARRRQGHPDFAPYNYSAVLRLPYKTGLLFPTEMQWYNVKPSILDPSEGADFYGGAEQRLRKMHQVWKSAEIFAFISKAEHFAELKRIADEEEAERQRIIDLEEAERQRIIDLANEEKRLAELEARRIREEIEAERARLEAIEEEKRLDAKRKADLKRKEDRDADNRQIYRSRRADFEVKKKEFGLTGTFHLHTSHTADSPSDRDRDRDQSPDAERPKSSPAHNVGGGHRLDMDHVADKSNFIYVDKETQEAEKKQLMLQLEMEIRKKLEKEAEKKREEALAAQVKRMEELQIEVRRRAEHEAYTKIKEELDKEYKKKRDLEEERSRKELLEAEKRKQLQIDSEKARVAQLEAELRRLAEVEALNVKRKEIEAANKAAEESARIAAENVRRAAVELEKLRQADLEEEVKRKADIEAGILVVDAEEEAKRLQDKEDDYNAKALLAAESVKRQEELEEQSRLQALENLAESKIKAEIDRLNKIKADEAAESERQREEEAENQRLYDLELEAKRLADAETLAAVRMEIENMTKIKQEMEISIAQQTQNENELKLKVEELESKRLAEMDAMNKVNMYVSAASRFSNKSNYVRNMTKSPFRPKTTENFAISLSSAPILDESGMMIAEHALEEDATGASPAQQISKLYYKNRGQTYNSVADTIVQKQFDYVPHGTTSAFTPGVAFADPFLNSTLTSINMRSKSPLKNSMNRAFPKNHMRKVMKQMNVKLTKEEAKKRLVIWWRYLIPRRRLLDRMFKVDLAKEILDDVINRVHIRSVQLIKYRIYMLRNGAARILQRFSRDYVKFTIMKRITLKKEISREIAWYLLDRWANAVLASLIIWKFIIRFKVRNERRKTSAGNPKLDPKKAVKTKDVKSKSPFKDTLGYYMMYAQFCPRVFAALHVKNLRKKLSKVDKKKKSSAAAVPSSPIPLNHRHRLKSGEWGSRNRNRSHILPVVKVQSLVRMYLAKKRVKMKKIVGFIYFKVLSFMKRSKVKRLVRDKKKKNEKAVVIQKNIRGFLGRRLTFRIVHAAFVIIRSWKRYFAMSVLRGRLRRVDRPYTLELNEITNIREQDIDKSFYCKISVFWNPLLHIVKGTDYMTVVNLKQPQIIKKSIKFETIGTNNYAKPIDPALSQEGDGDDDDDEEEEAPKEEALAAINKLRSGRLGKLTSQSSVKNIGTGGTSAALTPMLSSNDRLGGGRAKIVSGPQGGGGGGVPLFSFITRRLSNALNLGSLTLPTFRKNRGPDTGKPLRKCDFNNYQLFIPGCHGKSVIRLEFCKPGGLAGGDDEVVYTWYFNIADEGKLLYWGGDYRWALPLKQRRLNLKNKKKVQGQSGLLSERRKERQFQEEERRKKSSSIHDDQRPTLSFKIHASPAMMSKCGWIFCFFGSHDGPLKSQLCKRFTMLNFMMLWKKIYISMNADHIMFYDDRYSVAEFARWEIPRINKCDIKAGQSLSSTYGIEHNINPRKEDLCDLEIGSKDGDVVVFRCLSASDRVQWIDVFQNLIRKNLER